MADNSIEFSVNKIFEEFKKVGVVNTNKLQLIQAIDISVEKLGRITLKEEVAREAIKNQSEVQKQIYRGLTGRPLAGKLQPFNSSQALTEHIKTINVLSSLGATRADRFIRTRWEGNWYAYKASLLTQRLKKSTKAEHNLRNTASGRKSALTTYTNKRRKTDKSPVTEDNIGFEAVGRPRRTGNKKHSYIVPPSKRPSTEEVNSFIFGDDHFDELNTLKRTIRNDSQPHATAKAKLYAKHMTLSRHKSVPYTKRSGKGQHYLPYVKTGTLAKSLAFSFNFADIRYTKYNKQEQRFMFNAAFGLNINKIPTDVREAWVYSKPIYKEYVLSGTSAIVEEYLKVIINSRFKTNL